MNPEGLLQGREPVGRIVPILVILTLLGVPVILLSSMAGVESPVVIYVSIASIVYFLTLFDIRIGLTITVAAIGLAPEFSAGVVADLRIEDFLIPVILFSWLTRRETARPTLMRGPMLMYIVVSLIATFYGAAMQTIDPIRGMFIAMKSVEYFVLLYLVVNIVRSEDEIRFFTYVFILVGLFAAAQGIFMGWRPDRGIVHRVSGPMGETANIFAGYLTIIISLCIGLVVQTSRLPVRLFLVGTILFLFYACLLTFSRTGYVSLFSGLGIFSLFKRRQLILLILIILVLFPLLAPESVWERASTIGGIFVGELPESARARKQAWEVAWYNDIAQSPLIGNGPGYLPFGYVDNEYVRILVDIGFAGLIAFLWLIFRLFQKANQSYNASTEGTFHRGLSAGYFIALIAMSVHAFGATSFTSIRSMEAFIILTGIFLAQWQGMQAESKGGTESAPSSDGTIRNFRQAGW